MRIPSILALSAALLSGAPITAQVFTPALTFSVHDEPPDGVGDSFNASTWLIRTQSSRADRAMQEFDFTASQGLVISSATLSGKISANNAFNNGLRTFDFILYAGNGQADLGDYQIPGIVVGTGSYSPPLQTSFTYSIDVTAALQTILDCGAPFVGLKVVGTSNPSFPNVLDDMTSKISVTAAATRTIWTDLGNGLTGTHGAPFLGGRGALVSFSQIDMTICNLVPMAPGVLILGTQNLGLPLFGGTLVPSPTFLFPLTASPEGAATLGFPLQGLTPSGGAIFFQAWFLDALGPQGFSATNAVTQMLP